MSRPSAKSRRNLADRLRVTLEVMESGRITVGGEGHNLKATVARLRERIAELERSL
jgi:hypothetical protein